MLAKVGESNHPSFRPGLEGGSSDDEASAPRGRVSLLPGIEQRRSAEGQVLSSPVTGTTIKGFTVLFFWPFEFIKHFHYV